MWRRATPDVEKLLRPTHEVEDDEEQDDNASSTTPDKSQDSGPPLLLVLLVLTLFVAALPTVRLACSHRAARHSHAPRPHPGAALESWRETVHRAAGHAEEEQPAELIVQEDSLVPHVKREAEAEAARSVLECFQAAQPVLFPQGATTTDGRVAEGTAPKVSSSCTSTLMVHSFGNSYGQPFVGNYVPPSCDFNRVVLNFTTVSQGRQYDRLALMYLGDIEVWRTSTAEPTSPPGIRWVYLKDMTQYLSLWKRPQKLIFDLGNLINDKYTGPFNTTLTATFFKTEIDINQAPPSDLVIPISARNSGAATDPVSRFTLPDNNATNTISFPRNANRAVFSVSANGQASEEFWWSNVLSSDAFTFNKTAGQFPGFSPFREVQVYIDGQLAGVQWPYPVVFTGGIVPSLHRPIVGIDVFDLREHEIDITPWLPLLCDGAKHTFTIQVAGLADNGKTAELTQQVDSNWVVTGKIFVWLDSADSITTGTPPNVAGIRPTVTITRFIGQNSTGGNETLDFTASIARSFSVQGFVKTQKSSSPATWAQSLSYSNHGTITARGFNQVNDMAVRGSDASDGLYKYKAEYQFPLWVNTTTNITPQGNLTLWAHMRQGLELHVTGSSVFPDGLEAWAARKKFDGGSLLRTTHEGIANFYQSGDGKSATGSGAEGQIFRFGGLSNQGILGEEPAIEIYFRNVTSANDTLISNRETLAGASVDYTGPRPSAIDDGGAGSAGPLVRGLFAQAPTLGGHGFGPRTFMGRGGPDPEVALDELPSLSAPAEMVAGQVLMEG